MHSIRFLLKAILVHGALAIPSAVHRRDLAAIQGAISSVQDSLQKLDTAVKGLSNDAATAPPVLTASQNVEAAIKKATTDITGSQELSLIDAVGLQGSASGLTTAVQTTINDLTSKKAVLDKLGVTSVALTALQTQRSASAALGSALVSKVPAIGQGIAQQNVDQINSILDKGIAALQAGGTGSTPAAGGNGAGTGAAPPAPKAPAEPPAAGKGNGTSPATGGGAKGPAEPPATGKGNGTAPAAPPAPPKAGAEPPAAPPAPPKAGTEPPAPPQGPPAPPALEGGAKGPLQCTCTCR